jgi:hypothetical protein
VTYGQCLKVSLSQVEQVSPNTRRTRVVTAIKAPRHLRLFPALKPTDPRSMFIAIVGPRFSGKSAIENYLVSNEGFISLRTNPGYSENGCAESELEVCCRFWPLARPYLTAQAIGR